MGARLPARSAAGPRDPLTNAYDELKGMKDMKNVSRVKKTAFGTRAMR